jgi:Rod binding domain-containing protein
MQPVNAAAYGLPPLTAQSRQTEEPPQPPLGTRNIEQVRQRARDQAQEFESVFLTTFVQQMFSGLDTDSPFSGGHAEGIYQSMMSEQYASSIARSGGIGIADHVYAEIMKSQQIDP